MINRFIGIESLQILLFIVTALFQKRTRTLRYVRYFFSLSNRLINRNINFQRLGVSLYLVSLQSHKFNLGTLQWNTVLSYSSFFFLSISKKNQFFIYTFCLSFDRKISRLFAQSLFYRCFSLISIYLLDSTTDKSSISNLTRIRLHPPIKRY